jgi:uncharacterized phage infection (PIP) family protein YhgE
LTFKLTEAEAAKLRQILEVALKRLPAGLSTTTENSESTEGSETTETSEASEASEATEDGESQTESSESSETSETTENSEDTENSENTENDEALFLQTIIAVDPAPDEWGPLVEATRDIMTIHLTNPD